MSVDILISPSIRCPHQLVRGPRHYRIRASKMSWTCLHCNSTGRGMMSLYYRQVCAICICLLLHMIIIPELAERTCTITWKLDPKARLHRACQALQIKGVSAAREWHSELLRSIVCTKIKMSVTDDYIMVGAGAIEPPIDFATKPPCPTSYHTSPLAGTSMKLSNPKKTALSSSALVTIGTLNV